MASQAPAGGMTLPCRLCWWAADITRGQERVWCSHAVHHGWMTDKAKCDTAAFKPDDDRGSGK